MNNNLKRLAWLVLPLTLAACGGSDDGSQGAADTGSDASGPVGEGKSPGKGQQPVPVASAQFIAMGDSGTGSAGHYAVGEAMAAVCEIKATDTGPCEFVLGFGDNIYDDGATSVDDVQFQDKFEKPFEPMGSLPFYMVLGNHDNTGYIGGDGANNSRGDIQVDYHYEGNSPRWFMPSRYYAFNSNEIPTASLPKTREGKPLLTIVSMDSNPIASLVADADSRFTWQKYGMTQLVWAQDELIASDALFNIAMAHHPYLSNGQHGNAGNYDFVPSYILPVISGQRWKEFLEEGVCDYADFLMTGHDHDLQLLEPVESCGRTRFLVSGAAGKTRSLVDENRNQAMFQAGDTYGFFWVRVTESNPLTDAPAQMCFEAYTVDPDAEGFGVLDTSGALTPAYSRCLAKAEPQGIARGKDFSGNPVSASVPLADESGFDAGFAGPLQSFREELVSGLNTLNMNNPSDEAGQVVGQLIGGIDTLLAAMDAAASAGTEGGNPDDIQQTTFAVQAAADRLQAVDTSSLPAPFDQLGDAFTVFAEGFGSEASEGSGQGLSQDTAFLLGPVVQLTINLDNILDGIDAQAQPVPVLRGVTSLLVTTLRGVSGTLEQVSRLDSSAGSDELIGAINQALNTLVDEVLLLEQAPQPIGQYANLPADFLSDGLKTVLNEVTEQLDRTVLGTVDGLLGRLLAPITGLITGLLDRLF
ncbi:metallophosphoesterase-like protein [Marinobacter vinifirmus]|uniref:Metallophosphoesterase-like protein n=1 Tax=Marinobacter vinifirmus TaxID=355591 RepID=A0A7Z1DSI5_9GAMM|nr:metallophosphoesterase [Marinobacter vinifirmus]OZC35198.1 metallophosphoesterase-like protein [Marinobacter vinifirmus]